MSEAATKAPSASTTARAPVAQQSPVPQPPIAQPPITQSAPQAPAQQGGAPANSVARERARNVTIMAPATEIRRLTDFHQSTYWQCVAPAKHTLEEALSPYYLWHRSSDFRVGDRVDIRHKLNHYLIELLILEVNKATMSVTHQTLNVHDLTKKPVTTGDLVGAIPMMHGDLGWVVQRGHVRLSPVLVSEEAALAWIANQQKRIDEYRARNQALA